MASYSRPSAYYPGDHEMRDCRSSGTLRGGAPSTLALALLVFASLLLTVPARSAEPVSPSINIDHSRAPFITVEARDIAISDLLKELSKRLHVVIEGVSAATGQEKVTVSANGELEDVLRRVLLPGKGLVVLYKGRLIDKIIVVQSSGEAGVGGGEAKLRPEAQTEAFGAPASQAEPRLPLPTGAADTAAPVPIRPSQINTILQKQVEVQRQFETGAGAHNPGAAIFNPGGKPGTSGMAALTQTARQNVLALTTALRAVCLAPNCGK